MTSRQGSARWGMHETGSHHMLTSMSILAGTAVHQSRLLPLTAS